MDQFAESAVVYDGLPISSGGAHGLGRISARGALSAWLRFLEARTQASPISCSFDLSTIPELAVGPRAAELIAREFPASRLSHIHPVQWDRVNDALSIFESLDSRPVEPWGMAPVRLWFTADFLLQAPSGQDLWPGQDPRLFNHFKTPGGLPLGVSSARLMLQIRCSMGLSLCIPRASDTDLAELVPWLQAALPMRLSAKQWTRWTLTKNKFSYRGKKIALIPPA
jgi:hypothetical protein